MAATRNGGSERRAMIAVALGAVLGPALLAGCLPSGGDEPPGATTPGTAAAPGDPRNPGAAPTNDRCPQPVDLSGATWTWPDGFEEAGGYAQVVPLGEQVFARYAVPGERGQDLLAVVLYDDVPRTEPTRAPDVIACLEEAAATIEQINAELDVTVLAGPVEIVVDGVPALREEVSQPGGYTYHAIWVPSGPQLLHVSCQYAEREELITAACDELLASVVLAAP